MAEPGKIIVCGAGGQVGSALLAQLGPARGVGLDFPEIDFSRPLSLVATLRRLADGAAVEAIVNAAGYTQVDRAEREEDLARTLNAAAPGMLARWCAATATPFVHYSSDYVFPGTGERPWRESDTPAPLNAYGRTKLQGDWEVLAAGGPCLVLRTSWVYSWTGRNFFLALLALGRERDRLTVVADQHGAPTFADDLARATLQAVTQLRRKPTLSGLYNLCSDGQTTWHGFAEEIINGLRRAGVPLVASGVDAISSAQYTTPAKRPLNSRLDCSLARERLGVALPDWTSGLGRCIERYVAANPDACLPRAGLR
jgi:dTDP-4-dehydrorhamnose reductase